MPKRISKKKSKTKVKKAPVAATNDVSSSSAAEAMLMRLSRHGPSDTGVLNTLEIPTLVDLSLDAIVSHFEEYPIRLTDLHPRFHDQVVSMLPVDLPLETAVRDIESELYWQRRCNAHWDNCRKERHGSSWKRLFMERGLEEMLEEFDPQQILVKKSEKQSILKQFQAILSRMEVSRDYVHGLVLKQMVSHLDLNILFNNLPNLATLVLTYGVRQLGIDFEWGLFGMRPEDCHSLSHAIRNTRTLTILELKDNLLDDKKIRVLASGLAHNSTIISLSLAHNKIGDTGARALAKVLSGRNCVISSLDLCDNQIEHTGGSSLARALEQNVSLIELNLRLNRLGDEGAKAIAEALRNNHSLLTLDMSSNNIGVDGMKGISALLRGTSLKKLVLNNNPGAAERDFDLSSLHGAGIRVDARVPQKKEEL